ncbi:bifunctional DNA primase/polymerase [Streptomyces sp. NPDC050504]|uniref:bifunctional DNA primase/polymerase n=1 Tax=Streptomyces sp. NPDC050504 TaxID=3365618 RepID=UPI00379BD896
MPHPNRSRREGLAHQSAPPLDIALALAARGVPVLPLRVGKAPFGNCEACTKNACGGRPNMKQAGPCTCPRPCHGWAAATTDLSILTSTPWTAAWHKAAAVAYHPAGARLTVVDLDNAAAIAWAHTHLPPTRTVPTTRGQHWIYAGTMPSANGVRPGVDVKSRMSYARWLSPGSGRIGPLPNAVRELAPGKPTPAPAAPQPFAATAPDGTGECRHRTPVFLERGIAMAEQRIVEASSGIHATVYRTFLAVLSTHGRCGCLTDTHVERLFTAAQAKGETARHCADAWANARTALGM